MRTHKLLVVKEIIALAREIGIKEEYVRLLLSGAFDGIYIVHITTEGSYQILARRPGERVCVKMKRVMEKKKEIVEKMQRQVKLAKFYMALKEIEELDLELEPALLEKEHEAVATA